MNCKYKSGLYTDAGVVHIGEVSVLELQRVVYVIGSNFRLKPPRRFMYCLYLRFFCILAT